MAVYKATYCYPFLTSVDTRVATIIGTSGAKPVSYLKCKIDTSNKNITGYRIRLIDSNNNQIFPVGNQEGKISPISELITDDDGNNTGVNGTFLIIPFFQNYNETDFHMLTKSHNNIYYKGDYLVDYLISDISDGTTKTGMDLVTNWSYNSEYDVLTYNNWSSISSGSETISINGDCPIGGQLVLFNDTADVSSKNGIYKITTETIGDEEQIVLKLVENNFKTTTVTKGTYHNKIIKQSENASYYTGLMWQCYNNGDLEDIPNLYINTNIKWEITLYQGVGEISVTSPLEITYDNLSNEEYDMIMTSGKILGSTPERIQISDIDETTLPSANGEVLVLQTRWIQLESSSLPNGNNQGTRAYVQTYDSVYGHVYPTTDSLSSYAVDSANTCKFYKHSNNQDDILDTDIVKVGININVNIVHYTDSGNNFLYTTTDLSSYSLTDGDSILLTGQTSNEQNGVYTYYESTSEGDTYKYRLRRNYSYSNWASYIGKVIYCTGGDWAGQNVECLAQSGTYTLWNPLQNIEDGNSLIFKKEQPILLFRSSIDYTVDYYYDNSIITSTISAATLDGEKVSTSMIGQTIFSADRKIFTITNVDLSGETPELTISLKENIEKESFRILFNHGKICGGNVYYISGTGLVVITEYSDPDYSLYTAKILKNTLTRTYISPYINISNDMKIKVYSGENPQWIKINSFNKVLWCIDHDTLSTPFLSYSLSDSNIPYKYDIRSFFKTSDENPIYLYETPYIKLYKEGLDFTDLSSLNKTIEQLLVEGAEDDYDDYYVKEREEQVEDANAVFYVQAYQDRTVIDRRYVNLAGKFVSFGNSSWESYRWYLYDGQGKKVQDTGKKYDKNIQVSFYGLSNDMEEDVVYYAVLVVEDSLKTELKYIIRMKIGYDKDTVSSAVNKEFTAAFDCRSYSVELNYENFGSVYPAILYTNNEIQAIVEENVNNLSLDWKELKLYYDNGWMNIGEPSRIIYQDLENNVIPLSVTSGVSYFTVFGKGNYTLQQADLSTNHLSLDSGQNEIYMQLGVEITENFCGDIVNFVIDAADNDFIGPYIDEDYDIQYTSNSLNFRIYTEDNFNTDNIAFDVNELRSDRDTILLEINKINGSNGSVSSFINATIVEEFFEQDTLPKYYLQVVPGGNSTEYLHYYLYKNSNNTEVITSHNNSETHVELYIHNNAAVEINKDPGCLNLTKIATESGRENNNIASYWVENKKVYYLLDTEGIFENFDVAGNVINNNSLCFVESNTQDDEDELYWPDEENESNYYWNDGGYSPSSSSQDPIYYDDTNASTTGYTNIIAKDRHQTTKKYNIVLSISKISELYNDLSNCDIVQDETDNTKFNIINGTETYGYVQIKIME